MSQQLLDLISRVGGNDAVAAMAARVGLSPEQTQSAMAALMPAVAGGLSKRAAADPAGFDAAAGPAADLAPGSESAMTQGAMLNSQIFGGDAAAVTEHAAQSTGLDAGILAKLLPMVTSLAAGTLASGRSGPQGASGTLAGMLDLNRDGNPLDDVMRMAGKLFGR